MREGQQERRCESHVYSGARLTCLGVILHRKLAIGKKDSSSFSGSLGGLNPL